MSLRTRASEVHGNATAKVLEKKADFGQSGAQEGGVKSLERLHQLIHDPEFVKNIENTEFYKRNGYAWFWTGIKGTEKARYHRITSQGFEFISNNYDAAVKKVPHNELAYFYKGSNYLSVGVRRSDVDYGRLLVDGFDGLDGVAPVVVVDNQDGPSPSRAKASQRTEVHGVLVATEKFDAGKVASIKAEALLRAADRDDLADAIRAVFGE